MKKIMIFLVLMVFVAVNLPQGALAEVKVGILAKRGAPKCMQKWGAMGAYLTEQIGDKVKIVPLKFEAIEPAVAGGKVDFVLANSAFYVGLEKKMGVKAVATLINSRKGNALSEFGGVILVKADSPIQNLADISGKKFMVVKKSSFGGAQMAWRLLMDNGINPETDCAEFMMGSKHDNVVLAVLNGVCEVGSVRSDTMERMADEGTINMADFRIINQVEGDFPFVHSTRLYPEWPMAACAQTDQAITDKLVTALKSMD
ncbi:MAG: phosphate/phosphite/phosphonate ABC transporter substrate-binding protein, partial [Bacteroidales bacterium]|nr:phosphate/phosphite/phosphonate ABC transporter substrate-binding protein [Candidatus Latescibacterota bacterium]